MHWKACSLALVETCTYFCWSIYVWVQLTAFARVNVKFTSGAITSSTLLTSTSRDEMQGHYLPLTGVSINPVTWGYRGRARRMRCCIVDLRSASAQPRSDSWTRRLSDPRRWASPQCPPHWIHNTYSLPREKSWCFVPIKPLSSVIRSVELKLFHSFFLHFGQRNSCCISIAPLRLCFILPSYFQVVLLSMFLCFL